MSTQAAKNVVLCKEFPFLKRYLPHVNYEARKIFVSRINYSLLKERTNTGSTFVWKRIFFLDSEGNELMEVGYKVNHRMKFQWWKPWTWNKISIIPCEAVEDAFLRIGEENIEKIRFILLAKSNEGIIIYKYPKNFTLKGWIKKELADAAEEVRRDFLKIDEA